ncbi:hypothetical protein MKK67_32365 [Methylobacterium sp. J-072]|uniref:hypothetical protein n=1 Tax=Methylobacterium sp. J-072 TaxID=2836651 RepID=UPI001FB9CF22|nr:hypothetical protein [Methylobacterium sp. J-072]MCJ2097177.1 hypothetical protein [Methylobacterium sp. J-072]
MHDESASCRRCSGSSNTAAICPCGQDGATFAGGYWIIAPRKGFLADRGVTEVYSSSGDFSMSGRVALSFRGTAGEPGPEGATDGARS